MSEDWTTGGDWLGRYGSRYALLCSMQSPLDHTVANDLGYNIKGRLGWNSTDAVKLEKVAVAALQQGAAPPEADDEAPAPLKHLLH